MFEMRISLAVVAIAVLILLALPYWVGAQWVQTNGPGGCSINSLAVIGTNLFASKRWDGVSTRGSGVFLSTDNGAHWKAVHSGLPAEIAVYCLAVSGTNLFAGTSDGVFLSMDSGASWKAVNSGLPSGDLVNCLAVNGPYLFAGTDLGGVFLSMDSGASWKAAKSGLPAFHSVRCLAASGSCIIAATRGGTPWKYGVYRSTDHGASWSAVSSGLPARPRVNCLAASGPTVYAGTWEGFFRSTDGGTSWTEVNSGLPKKLAVTFLLASGSDLYVGNRRVFVSSNSGADWTPIGSGPLASMINCLAVCGTNLYAGTDGGGIFRSTDNGTSWATANSGLPDETHIEDLETIGPNLFAATSPSNGIKFSGIYLSRDDGESWVPINSGLPFAARTLALAVIGPNLFARLIHPLYNPSENLEGVFASMDSGAHWKAINSGLPWGQRVSGLVAIGTSLYIWADAMSFLSKNNDVTWTAATLILSENNGATWTAVKFAWPERARVMCLAASGQKLYASVLRPGPEMSEMSVDKTGMLDDKIYKETVFQDVGLGVFRSVDNGTSWTLLSSGLPDGTYVHCLAASGSALYAGVQRGSLQKGDLLMKPGGGEGIFLSTNNGESWRKSSKGLPTNTIVNCFVVSGGNIFAGTQDFGIFLTTNSGKSWRPINQGLPRHASVSCLAVREASLYAGIEKGGVWRLALSGLAPKSQH
jgi:hypothetical protein